MTKFLYKTFIYLLLVVVTANIFNWGQKTTAATLTLVSDTMTRQKAATDSNHDIQFTTSTGVAAAQNITIAFPAGFTIGSVDFNDIDVRDDGTDLTLAGSASGTTWGASFGGGQTLTISSATGTIAAGSVVRILIGGNASSGGNGTRFINNPSIGTYVFNIAGTFGDTGSFAETIITQDQVSISGTVGTVLTFAITAGTTIDFGLLTATNYSFNSGTTIQASTNATSGYVITYAGDTLKSGGNTISAMNGTSSIGTNQFGLNLVANTSPTNFGSIPTGGSGAAYTGYDTNGTFKFVANANPLEIIANTAATSSVTTYTVSYLANIAANLPPGIYTTSLTYICTSTF